MHNLPNITETRSVYDAMMELPKHVRERARFYTGFANAMADQWGNHITAHHRASHRATNWHSDTLAALKGWG